MTIPETPSEPTADALHMELQQKEEKLRKLVRQLDQIARTEFRDRAQRLKQLREQRAELETEIDSLKEKIKQLE